MPSRSTPLAAPHTPRPVACSAARPRTRARAGRCFSVAKQESPPGLPLWQALRASPRGQRPWATHPTDGSTTRRLPQRRSDNHNPTPGAAIAYAAIKPPPPPPFPVRRSASSPAAACPCTRLAHSRALAAPWPLKQRASEHQAAAPRGGGPPRAAPVAAPPPAHSIACLAPATVPWCKALAHFHPRAPQAPAQAPHKARSTHPSTRGSHGAAQRRVTAPPRSQAGLRPPPRRPRRRPRRPPPVRAARSAAGPALRCWSQPTARPRAPR